MTFHIGTPHSRNAGYFVNDKELSTRQEDDVQACPHCQAIIKMREWSTAPVQNFCLKCMKPTCASPACQECVPFIQQLDRVFDATVKYDQYLKLAGLNVPAAAAQSLIGV